jgi:hypothetical protein
MTVGMLLLGIFWCFSGAIGANFLYGYLGVPGYIFGFVAGVAVGYLVSWLIMVARLLLLFPLPLCRRGKCQGYDQYYWKVGTVHGWEWWGIHRYRCNCENGEYIRKGKRFMIVLSDGELVPFKCLTGFRRWADGADEVR